MKRIDKICVVLMLMLLFAAPCAAEMLDLSALGEIEEALSYEEETVQKEWTYPISYELLTTSDYIVLANRESLLDEDYVPDDLTKDLSCRKISYDPIQMRQTAADALCALFDAAEKGELEEAFGSGTAAVVSPVGRLAWNDKEITISGGQIGAYTQKFYDTLTGIQFGTVEDPFGWVLKID